MALSTSSHTLEGWSHLILYKKAIVEQHLHYGSLLLLDPHLSLSDQLFIERPG